MHIRKDICKVLIGVIAGIIIIIAVQKGLKLYKHKQLIKDYEQTYLITQMSKEQLKKVMPELVIKNISVGNANENDLKKEKIKVIEIKKDKFPLLIVKYEVEHLTDYDLPFVQTGIPYKVTVRYEKNGLIKEFSYIVFYNQNDDSFINPSEIDILKKNKDALILFER